MSHHVLIKKNPQAEFHKLALREALEDRRFTLREKKARQKEMNDAINALHELRASIVKHDA